MSRIGIVTTLVVVGFGCGQRTEADCPPCWQPVGGGLNGTSDEVWDMVVFDDGTGEALYAGGVFTDAGGVPVSNLAKWDGQQWSDVGGGVQGAPSRAVYSLYVHDDGSGPALFVGGRLHHAGGSVAVSGIAKWDGKQWSALGSGVDGPPQSYGNVFAMGTFDDGVHGPRLYVGGNFFTAGGITVRGFACWDGVQWSKPPGKLLSGSPEPVVVNFEPVENGRRLSVGGTFDRILMDSDSIEVDNTALFDGMSWSPMGDGLPGYGGLAYRVADFCLQSVGGRPTLMATGAFGGYVAQWDGAAWSIVGGGLGPPHSFRFGLKLFQHDDGSGSAVYVGGNFFTAGGAPATNVARWNGSSWSSVGSGLGAVDTEVGSYVESFAVFRSELYAGGNFKFSGDLPMASIARWASLRGDLDCDGAVGQGDLGVLLAAYGCTDAPCSGDLDGDGDTDQGDLGVLLAAYGQRCPN